MNGYALIKGGSRGDLSEERRLPSASLGFENQHWPNDGPLSRPCLDDRQLLLAPCDDRGTQPLLEGPSRCGAQALDLEAKLASISKSLSRVVGHESHDELDQL